MFLPFLSFYEGYPRIHLVDENSSFIPFQAISYFYDLFLKFKVLSKSHNKFPLIENTQGWPSSLVLENLISFLELRSQNREDSFCGN